MARTFTRQEFYDLVWSKPVTHLAKEFALSDVAIHKICRKHEIPTPPLGWWAKKAGKAVVQTKLPKSSASIQQTVTIASPDFWEKPGLSSVRKQADPRLHGWGRGDAGPSHHPADLGAVAKSQAWGTGDGVEWSGQHQLLGGA